MIKSWIGELHGGRLIDLFDETNTTSPMQNWPEGSMVRISDTQTLLAEPQSAQAVVLKTLQSLRMNPEHPVGCEAEAHRLLDNPGLDDEKLTDLRLLDFVTIDNEGSRDLDQALYIASEDTGFRVYYALADASWYVQPGTALFQEAIKRGATYYAPGLAAPMLPRSLSEGLVSLNPDVERRALVFDISLDQEGHVVKTDIVRARIRSRAKLSYNGVQEFISAEAKGEKHDLAECTFAESLRLLKTVGKLRIGLARQRNVIEYNRREPQVHISENDPGKFDINMRERNNVERYNEQISLLCNIEGARLLEKYTQLTPELQSVYRVHNPPMYERLANLHSQLRELTSTWKLDKNWQWDGKSDLSSYLDNLPDTVAMRRLKQAIERQILLTNNASEFSADPGPHHALGVDAYARFSSPMREIVGIFTHKELLEALELQTPQDIALDEKLRGEVITIANQAKQLQKQLDKEFQLLVIDHFLHADLDLTPDKRPERSGTVMGMRGSRIYISVDGFALDLKVYASDLDKHWNCRYTVEATQAFPDSSDAPVFRMGDGVRVKTLSWDTERRRFLLDVVPTKQEKIVSTRVK